MLSFDCVTFTDRTLILSDSTTYFCIRFAWFSYPCVVIISSASSSTHTAILDRSNTFHLRAQSKVVPGVPITICSLIFFPLCTGNKNVRSYSFNSTAECNKVVSDIFGKFEFLMKYQNMAYAHFAPFLKIIILLVSEILSKNGVKSVVSAKNIYR